jgi:hypothetical protein
MWRKHFFGVSSTNSCCASYSTETYEWHGTGGADSIHAGWRVIAFNEGLLFVRAVCLLRMIVCVCVCVCARARQ